MGVPVLKLGATLIASVQGDLTDTEWDALREELLARAVRDQCRGAIIDLTGMDVMDSFAGRTLGGIAQMLRLRGVDAVVVGIQPEVAFSMVQLGLHLGGVTTALDLDEGVELLRRRAERTATDGS